MFSIESIKSLSVYDDVDTLAQDYYEDYDNLTEDQRDFLSHVSDYESVRFAVLNDESVLVLDRICGDVIGHSVTVEEVVSAALDGYEEN